VGRSPAPLPTSFTYELTISCLPWVERRQEGHLLPWGRALRLSKLPFSKSLPVPSVERQQEGQLLPWGRAQHLFQLPLSMSLRKAAYLG
jgi:hypothetical protein